ncbi:MAG TPA: hypothetical protein VNA12_07085 [Mycobacteriales bacterium]|nr:hypothetical protein [Mycobacteriales bacterium]
MGGTTRRARFAAALVIGVGALTTATADAATRVEVPCDGRDGGPEGLRAAINEVNTAGGGEIQLEEGCTYAITKVDNRTRSGANGLPVIRTRIRITTLAERGLLSGIRVGGRRDPSASVVRQGGPAFRLFEVARGARLSLEYIDLAGGSAPTGGAVRNNGETLSLMYSSIDTSVATGPVAHGGGIWSASPVQLTYSHVRRTEATGQTAEGGGIWSGTSIHLQYSSVSRSAARARAGTAYGGGIFSRSGEVELTYSDASANRVVSAGRAALGGGIFAPGGVELTYSDVTNNLADGRPAEGGGVYSPRLGVDGTYSSVTGNRPDNCRC